MDIIKLLEKQNELEREAAEMKNRFPLNDKDECLRYASIRKTIKDLDAEIGSEIKSIEADTVNGYSAVTGAFARTICEAAEKGIPVEDVIFGEKSILDPRTVSYMYKMVIENGERVVIGGALSAQCKQFPWLLIYVTDNEVGGEPIWNYDQIERILPPRLSEPIGSGFMFGSVYQRSMVAFFKREYVRQAAE